MYATTRQYSGLDRSALDEIARRRGEVEEFVRGLPGLVSWFVFTTENSMTTITISEDRKTAEDIVLQVASWIRQNMPTFLPNPPEVKMGEVIAQTSKVGRM